MCVGFVQKCCADVNTCWAARENITDWILNHRKIDWFAFVWKTRVLYCTVCMNMFLHIDHMWMQGKCDMLTYILYLTSIKRSRFRPLPICILYIDRYIGMMAYIHNVSTQTTINGRKRGLKDFTVLPKKKTPHRWLCRLGQEIAWQCRMWTHIVVLELLWDELSFAQMNFRV